MSQWSQSPGGPYPWREEDERERSQAEYRRHKDYDKGTQGYEGHPQGYHYQQPAYDTRERVGGSERVDPYGNYRGSPYQHEYNGRVTHQRIPEPQFDPRSPPPPAYPSGYDVRGTASRDESRRSSRAMDSKRSSRSLLDEQFTHDNIPRDYPQSDPRDYPRSSQRGYAVDYPQNYPPDYPYDDRYDQGKTPQSYEQSYEQGQSEKYVSEEQREQDYFRRDYQKSFQQSYPQDYPADVTGSPRLDDTEGSNDSMRKPRLDDSRASSGSSTRKPQLSDSRDTLEDVGRKSQMDSSRESLLDEHKFPKGSHVYSPHKRLDIFSTSDAKSSTVDERMQRINQDSARRRSQRRERPDASALVANVPEETRVMEAAQIVEILKRKIAFLSGGRDKRGGPILTFPSHGSGISFPPQDIMACVGYLSRIPSEDSSRHGFTVIIDNRQGTWTTLKTLLKLVQQSIPANIHLVMVVKAEDKRQFNLSFRKEKNTHGIEPLFITIPKLLNFINRSQLTVELGGDLVYDHDIWLKNRLAVEKFLREARSVSKHMDVAENQIFEQLKLDETASPRDLLRQHQHLHEGVIKTPEKVIQHGRDLLHSLQSDAEGSGFRSIDDSTTTLDNLASQGQVRRMLEMLESKVDRVQDYWESRERELSRTVRFTELEKGMKKVVDWILGPAEKILASKNDIGDSCQAADNLRKEQENLELKCTETYGDYAELRHTAEQMMKEGHLASEDIKAQKEYMDSVCRSYASRIERRRNLIITSVRFHRLAEEFSQRLDDLLELLVSDIEAEDVETAETAVKDLQEKCDTINVIAQQTLNEGQNLLDQMAIPIKNAFGKNITPDYTKQIAHVEKLVGELQERKLRCDELSDVRKLKLQQILQLRTCERDADQAINWILELCDVMVSTHTEMGKNPAEAETLQEEHRKFEATAQGTYEYGKQLL